MQYIRVKNWDQYQHYRHRTPSWIKLYRSLRSNYEWCRLSDAARGHLVGIWLLASEKDGKMPCDADWIGQQISATSKIDLDELVSLGFLELDGESCGETPCASALETNDQNCASTVAQSALAQSREEKSREEKIRTTCSDLHGGGDGAADDTPDGFAEFWASYPAVRKRDKAKCQRWWSRHVTDPELVIDGLDAWRKSDEWQREDGKYVPAPYVWLSNQRWETPPEPRRVLGCIRDEEVPF